MSPEIRVREARSEDAPRLKQLINDLGHPIEVADIIRNLDTLSSIGLLPRVATEGDRIIGMCGLSAMTTVHRDAPVGRVSVMIVDEAYRGRKIGALLLAEAERLLAERGCKILEVTSNMKRDRAHHFYEVLGYERTSYRFMKRL